MPLALFVLAASVLATTWADVAIAQSFFFDGLHGRWIGAGNWWIEDVIHTGGRWAVRVIVLAAIVLWVATCINRELRTLRRPAAYFIVSVVLSVGIVGLLKSVTNVDCPWDLTLFGGRYPFVHLFSHRPAELRVARCFPAAHASSGYALLALYFAFRERSATLARLGLVLGIGTGLIFGLAQQARGAHFVSHDVWSFFITWMVALTIYAVGFKSRLWTPVDAAPPELSGPRHVTGPESC
jgi:membrane-associated PAP2 superfamily phosphatase